MLKDSKSAVSKQSKRISQLSRTTKSALLPNEDFIENLVVIPPDGGWGWMVVFMSFVCNFLTDGIMYTFGIFLGEISESFHVHPTNIATATSLMAGFYYIVGPLTCALTNRYGFRVVGVIGGLISCSAFILATIFTNLKAFIFLIGCLGGIGFNMIFLPALLIVGFYFERWRALATAVSVCGSSLGILAFPSIVNTLLHHMHWTLKFRILGGLLALTVFCAFAYKPLMPLRLTDDKKVTFIVEDDDADSIGSFHIERDSKQTNKKQVLQTYQNSLFPTASAFHAASSVYLSSRRMNDDAATMITARLSGSDPSITRSVFTYKTDAQSVGLSTVYEYDTDLPKKCCNRKCWRQLFCCCFCCGRTRSHYDIATIAETVNRPMYRDDILYGGSLFLLPQYSRATVASGPSAKKSAMSYHLSVTRVATQRDIEQNNQCVCCPEAVVRTIATMLDLKLLRSPSFVVLSISGFFTVMGLYCPFIFIVQRADEMKIEKKWCVLLLTIVGMSNAVGRILCGVTSFFPQLDPLVVSYITTFITGVIVIASNYLDGLEGQITFAVIFGASIASFTVLRSIVIVEMVGLENLTNAFGVTTLFFGIASFIGVPVAAILQNYTGKYDASFLFAGISIVFSSFLLVPLKMISKWEADKKKPKVTFKT